MTDHLLRDVAAAIESRLATIAVGAGTLAVVADNAAMTEPRSTYALASTSMQDHAQASMGGLRNLWRATGATAVQVFIPHAQGEAAARDIVDAITTSFRAYQSPTAPWISCVDPPRADGSPVRQGAWWVRNVTIPFNVQYIA